MFIAFQATLLAMGKLRVRLWYLSKLEKRQDKTPLKVTSIGTSIEVTFGRSVGSGVTCVLPTLESREELANRENVQVVAVIDIDSTVPSAFDEEDKKALEALAKTLGPACDW